MKRTNTPFDWNEDQTMRLKHLWLEGFSASEIGGDLGLSRNAVLGKIHRLKLQRYINNPKKTPRPRERRMQSTTMSRLNFTIPAERRGNAGQPKAQAAAARIEQRLNMVPAPADMRVIRGKAWQKLAGTMPVPLEELSTHGCKWPIGDAPMLFCNGERDGHHAYCGRHAQLANGGVA